MTRENQGAKMIGLRALSGARVYRREPVGGERREAGPGKRKLNNRDVKTEREARESILGMNSTWCREALGEV